MSIASGNALFSLLCVKEKYWRRKTPHTLSQHTVTLVDTHTHTHCALRAASTCLLGLWLLPSSV